MATTAIVGGTGLVGSNMLTTLLAHPQVSHIDFLARRPPPNETTTSLAESHARKLSTFISTAPPATWASHIRSTSPTPELFFSSLATTRARAGGLAAQHSLEYGANLELARAAKDAGTKVYVLISSGGANVASKFPYLKMKGQIEESVIALDFDKTVILRPGMLIGQREEKRVFDQLAGPVANGLGWISRPWLKDWWAHDANEVARAAVNAGLRALEGKQEEKVLIISGKDIVRFGKDEWNTGSS